MATTLVMTFWTWDFSYFIGGLVVAPFFFPVAILFINYLVFPFDYSIFGKCRRTPLPHEIPLKTVGSAFGWFTSWAFAGEKGRGNMGSVEWLLYQHGIGIKIGIFGNIFIPLAEIDAIDLEHGFDHFYYRNSSATLHHHCAEIRNPIYLPKQSALIMALYYPDKVVIRTKTT